MSDSGSTRSGCSISTTCGGELGRFGKVNARHGTGSRRKGPKPRLVPLINGADELLRWCIGDVLGQFGTDHTRAGAPLFPSERKNADGTYCRATTDVLRRSLADAADRHLPGWAGKLTPHVLRHYSASQLYLAGMNLFAIQEAMGHAWAMPRRLGISTSTPRTSRNAWVTGHGQRRVGDR